MVVEAGISNEKATATVMVVDDHTSSREYVARLLRIEGFNVLRAAQARDALALLEESRVDLILLDHMMPDMDGLEMLALLRHDERFQNLPVIMLSAMSDSETMQGARALGVFDYLIKSRFSAAYLLERIRDGLSHGPESPAS